MTHSADSRLIGQVLLRFALMIPVMGLLFFWPAGTFAYWEAWLYMAVLLIPFAVMIFVLARTDPALLERRMRTREQETEQRWIIAFSGIAILLAYLIPGFDHRFGWSDLPAVVVLIANGLVLFGTYIYFRVMRENSYASRVVEVMEDQEVIKTGPYGIVRHPMYSGALLMFLFSPVALGSFWGMIPAVALIPILAARLIQEERVLKSDLSGYSDYLDEIKYRLVPGIW